MNYIHNESCNKNIILHDCEAVRAELFGGTLSFFFEEGFWISPEHPESNCDTLVRTDSSQVDYELYRGIAEDVNVYVFCYNRYLRLTVRKAMPLEKLIEIINSKKAYLEFLYEYTDENSRIIKCALRYKKRPWYRECQMELVCKSTVYRWNTLRRECVW